ncbi:MAG: hypothetical protein AAGK57_12860, partial [Pseudomonadota bacterium]
VGRHNLIVPDGATLRWVDAALDLNRVTILPSDGRSARAQADRNQTGQKITKIILSERLGGWHYGVYEVADTQSPFRYEIASRIIDETLILTEIRQSKSRVPDPSAILPDRIHNTLNVSRGVEAFCFGGFGFSGHVPTHVQELTVGLSSDAWTATLDLSYLGPNVDPMAVPEPPAFPPGTTGVQRRTIAIERLGQPGYLDIVWQDDRPGVELKADLEGVQQQWDVPEISLSLSMPTGTADDAQDLALALLAGLTER